MATTESMSMDIHALHDEIVSRLKNIEMMETKTVTIETQLSYDELMEKLTELTVTDFSKFHTSPSAMYYGKLTSQSFDLKNIRYSPMSSAPNLEGEIIEGHSNTIVKVTMDIRSHYKIVRDMYYKTLLPIGVIVLLLSLLVLGGTDFQIHGIIFSGLFIVCAFLYVGIIKSMLIRTKKKELENFATQIKGHIL